MRPSYTAAIIGVTVLGVTGGVAYAAMPNVNHGAAGIERSAAAATREVLGPQVGGTAKRKFARAFCAPGDQGVIGGGFNIQGAPGNNGRHAFNTWGTPPPKAIPVVTEARVVHRENGATGWQVYATAPSNFTGGWWLQAIAMCA